MTHLEYEEAQERQLPSLIYLIDADNQPVLPCHVETGEGAEKLANLKSLLCKRHMVSFFTTPDDLAAKVLHDLPPVLQETGATVDGTLEGSNASDAAAIIQRFHDLPRRNTGQELVIRFRAEERFFPCSAEVADVLNLTIGASVHRYVQLDDSRHMYVYADDDMAEKILALTNNPVMISARVITAFGVSHEGMSPTTHEGLVVKEILSVEPIPGEDA